MISNPEKDVVCLKYKMEKSWQRRYKLSIRRRHTGKREVNTNESMSCEATSGRSSQKSL